MNYSENIAIIGGGNWGTAIAKKIGNNLISSNSTTGKSEGLVMWLYEELVNGRSLTETINDTHENIKYLPGIFLPPNVRATSDLKECVSNRKIFLFVIPHQFLRNVIVQMMGLVPSDAICVSLMKGIEATVDHRLKRFTTIIEEELGIKNCAAIMGANVANDVAHDHFAEATIGCLDLEAGKVVAELLECDSFRTEITDDVSTVEWCGALKNVYAVGAGKNFSVRTHQDF